MSLSQNVQFSQEGRVPCVCFPQVPGNGVAKACLSIGKRIQWVWLFRGIGSCCIRNARRKFTCYIFSFSHAKLFPGTHQSGCLFIPLFCLHLALLLMAFLLTNRQKKELSNCSLITLFRNKNRRLQLKSKLPTGDICISQNVELQSCQETSFETGHGSVCPVLAGAGPAHSQARCMGWRA